MNLVTLKNDILMDMLCQHTAEIHKLTQENSTLKLNAATVKSLKDKKKIDSADKKLKPMKSNEPNISKSSFPSSNNQPRKQHRRSKNRSSANNDTFVKNCSNSCCRELDRSSPHVKTLHKGSHVDVYQRGTCSQNCPNESKLSKSGSFDLSRSFGDVKRHSMV